MDKALVEQYLTNAEMNIAAARSELNKPDVVADISDCAQFTEALKIGGEIRLAQGTSCLDSNAFIIKGGTKLYGNGSTLLGGVYAIQVTMNQSDGLIQDLTLITQGQNACVNLGYGDNTQDQLTEVPKNWELNNIKMAGMMVKHAIAVNAENTRIINCSITGIVHPDPDCQALWLGNSPGGLYAEGCTFEARHECFLSGGASLILPVTRKNLKFVKCLFQKDLAWKSVYSVKNIFELKDGTDVIIQDCVLRNCWAGGQQGEAYMFTPSKGGQVIGVQVLNNIVENVSSICNITGLDASLINKTRTNVLFDGGTYKTNSAQMGGRGNFCLLDRGPEFLKVNDCDITTDGTTFIELTGTGKMDLLEITNSRFNMGKYGIRIGGLNDGDNSKGMIGTIKIEGNTIYGANSAFKTRYPNNTYA